MLPPHSITALTNSDVGMVHVRETKQPSITLGCAGLFSTRQHCAAVCNTCTAGQQPMVAPCQTSSLDEEKWWGCSSAEWLRRNCTTLPTKAARPGSSRASWEMMGVPWLSRLLANRLLASVACCPSSPTCADTASAALALKPLAQALCEIRRRRRACARKPYGICNGFCVLHALCTISQHDAVFPNLSS